MRTLRLLRALWSAALALSFAGCVDVPRPGFRRTGRLLDDLRERDEVAVVSNLPRVGERLRGPRYVVARERERLRVVAGALRATLRGDVVEEVSADVTTSRIKHAAAAVRGWVFVTEEGAVYASDTFTGALRPLGALRCAGAEMPAITPLPSLGRVGFIVGARAAWTDGVALATPEDLAVRAVVWSDVDRGLSLAGDGAVRATRDGGRTWWDVPLGELRANAVVGDAQGVHVYTSGGWRRVVGGEPGFVLEGNDTPAPDTHGPERLRPEADAAVTALFARGYETAPPVRPFLRCPTEEPVTLRAAATTGHTEPSR